MHFIEQNQLSKTKELALPFPLAFNYSENRMVIPKVWQTISDSEEMVTFYSTMQTKGWEVVFE